MLVEDGTIIAVQPGIKVLAATKVIDARSKWVIPGLIDAHVHLCFNMDSERTESYEMRLVKATRNALSRLDAGLWLAIAVTIIIVGGALAAPLLSPADPTYQTLSRRLLPPGADGYLLGTDHLGRDMLSRLLYGSRISIVVGLAAVVVAGTIGTTSPRWEA